jgi:hypothetical protein
MNFFFSKPQANPIIVIPIHRLPLNRDELRSLESIRRHLAKYLIDFIMPERLTLDNFDVQKNERVTRFPNRYFQSPDSYNGLLTSSWFYEQFIDFTHLLVCQLDCLIFKNELLHWCLKDWDYIGSPMLKNNGNPRNDADWVIGNGGLSLRKTTSFLRVLKSFSPKAVYFEPKTRICDAPDFALGYFPEESKYRFTTIKARINSIVTNWRVDQELRGFRANEDIFWSTEACKFDSSFRVAPFEEGLQFAFEKHASVLFHKNGNQLPFGCHAWKKYEPDFWIGLVNEIL